MELELVETSELVDELLRRFDHCVFSGLRGHDATQDTVAGFYKGNAFTCVGLSQKIAQRALDDFAGKSRHGNQDDL